MDRGMDRLWGRCDNRHPWFPIEDAALDSSYLCPVCLQPAVTTARTFLGRLRADRRRRRAG